MTDSIFFKFVARVMAPVLVMFSVFLLMRGHNEPGGGFVGGLVAAGSIVLMALAYGPDEVRRRLRIDFLRAMFVGIVLSVAAGVVGMILGNSFQQGFWWTINLRGIAQIEISTALIFDIGVYIVILGVTSSIVMAMADESEREDR
jgi:multicomponent Na+:H+ antiporter subunit B